MTRHRVLSKKTVQDIDERVERILRGLGNPEPPLQLNDVRELLKLDRQFYTTDDPGILQETVSKIRIAGIQVYKRPTLLVDAIRKTSLQALYLPDQRRILLDKSLPKLKHRWNEGHEIGHSLIPWHEAIMLGDNSCPPENPPCSELQPQIHPARPPTIGRQSTDLTPIREIFEDPAPIPSSPDKADHGERLPAPPDREHRRIQEMAQAARRSVRRSLACWARRSRSPMRWMFKATTDSATARAKPPAPRERMRPAPR